MWHRRKESIGVRWPRRPSYWPAPSRPAIGVSVWCWYRVRVYLARLLEQKICVRALMSLFIQACGSCPAATDIRHLSIYISKENLRDSVLINWIFLRPVFQNERYTGFLLDEDKPASSWRWFVVKAARFCFRSMLYKQGWESNVSSGPSRTCFVLIDVNWWRKTCVCF
jgi:hypothetical protein